MAHDEGRDDAARIGLALERRFGGSAPAVDAGLPGLAALRSVAERRSIRSYDGARAAAPDLVRLLCAVALSSPTKSDLQQRDIVLLEEAAQRRRVTALLGEAWIETAPIFLVFCGNNRRQRQIHEWRGRPFSNDHLDAFFNAAVDAGIALATFVNAAEAVGLGLLPDQPDPQPRSRSEPHPGAAVPCLSRSWHDVGMARTGGHAEPPAAARCDGACRPVRREQSRSTHRHL